MAREARNILIIQGHPDPKGIHFGHALQAAYAKGATEAGREVRVVCLARLNFPFLQGRNDQRSAPPQAIVQAQADITRADHVVMIYPLWNGGAPALVKSFLEQLFRPAFLFPDAVSGAPLGFFSNFTQRKALQGKTAHIVITMQMPAFVYRWLFRPHAEKSMLRVAGMAPVSESLIGGVESHNPGKRERWLRRMYVIGRDGR